MSSNDELAGLSVLVVEDEPETRALLTMYFSRHGAAVRSASNVAEAIALVTAARPDIVVSDLAMPTEDGYSFVHRMREVPGADAVPVISLSGFTDATHVNRAIEAGFQMHIAKPAKLRELLTVVSTLARSHRQSSVGLEVPPHGC